MFTIQSKDDTYRNPGEWLDFMEVESEEEAREFIRHLEATDKKMRSAGLVGRFDRTRYRIR